MEPEIKYSDNCGGREISEEKLGKSVSKITLDDPDEKCKTWLDKSCVPYDGDKSSVYSESETEGSVFSETTNNSAMDSGYVFQNDRVILSDRVLSDRNEELSLQLVVNKEKSKYDNINIYKSRKVHIGDVTYINGPVIVNTGNTQERRSSASDQDIDHLVCISRTNWLAQPPLGKKEFLKGPAKYVIICHTATEEGFTVAENTLLIRLIQTFHIESRKWDDIAYNFLIGSDGLAYEGRGWGVHGAHTRNYNGRSVGIAFIGCFLDHLPPRIALEKAKDIIKYGVERGSILPEYSLLAHCQCTAIESPGRKLFEEIKTWDHWDDSISVTSPAQKNEDKKNFPGGDNLP